MEMVSQERRQDFASLVFTEKSKILQGILEQVHQSLLQFLQIKYPIQLDKNVSDRLFQKLKKRKLKIIKEIIISEFSRLILNGFSEKQINEMINDYKKNNRITDKNHCFQLLQGYQLQSQNCLNCIFQKLESSEFNLLQDFKNDLKEEGILLPGRKHENKQREKP